MLDVFACIEAFISIHSPHTRGDPSDRASGYRLPRISIHSPHARGDIFPVSFFFPLTDFNPLPSCEGRHAFYSANLSAESFQSTPLMRGETAANGWAHLRIVISIHSPLTRGDSISLQKSIRIYVSLHNKTMIHRFSGLYKPLFCGAEPDIRGAKPTGKP